MKIAHIINPIKVNLSGDMEKKNSYLRIAQPVTFKSMLNAKSYTQNDIEVELFTAQFEEDRGIIPPGFNITKDIEKDIHHYVDLPVKSRRLPRIKDIIYRLYENSDAEYFIYTNVDIGLYKDFYNKVGEIIKQGYDGVCINRRVLPTHLDDVELNEKSMDLIYEQRGVDHIGSDCFIFRKDIVPNLKFRNMFIGFAPIGRCMKHQIKINSKRFKHFKEEFVTFHLGDETSWSKECDLVNEHYLRANRLEAKMSSPEVLPGNPSFVSDRFPKMADQNGWKSKTSYNIEILHKAKG